MPFERLDFTHFLPDVPDFLHGPQGVNLALGICPLHQSWREVRAPLQVALKGSAGASKAIVTFTVDEAGHSLEVVEAIPTDLLGVYLHGSKLQQLADNTSIWHLTHAGVATDVSRAAGYTGVHGFRFAQYGSSKVIGASLEFPLQIRTGAGAFADVVYSGTDSPQFEFIGRVRSRLLGAYVKEGASYFPHRIRWSAADDETDWDIVGNGPGQAEIKTDAGSITGLVCFEEFAILFQENAVHRLTFVGGLTGFQRQQIGSASDGKDFFSEPAAYGRDVYYLGRSGMKVIRNGSSVQPITDGLVDRFFLDGQKDYAQDLNFAVKAAVSHHWGVVAFLYMTIDATGQHPILALYEIASGRWGLLDLTDSVLDFAGGTENPPEIQAGHHIFTWNPPGGDQQPLCPLDDLGIWLSSIDEISGPSFAWSSEWFRFDDDVSKATFLPRFVSRVYEVPDAALAKIRRIRPLWRYNGALVDEPLITLTIDYDESPHLNSAKAAQWTSTTATDNTDDAGFVKTGLPVQGRYFQFTVDIASMPSLTIEEFDGLEFEVEFAGAAG